MKLTRIIPAVMALCVAACPLEVSAMTVSGCEVVPGPDGLGYVAVVPDWTQQWYYDAAEYCKTGGYMEGYGLSWGDGYFGAEDPLTRAELVEILWNDAGSPQVDVDLPFVDVTDTDWVQGPLKWAYSKGLIAGTNGDWFNNNRYMTRQDACTLLYRYAQLSGRDVSTGETGSLAAFLDAGDVADYAVAPVKWAVASGLTNGVDTGILAPTSLITRGQTATMIMRYTAK